MMVIDCCCCLMPPPALYSASARGATVNWVGANFSAVLSSIAAWLGDALWLGGRGCMGGR